MTSIVRKPIRKLKVTEEELSNSQVLQEMADDHSGLIAIVETLVNDFRNLIPSLVETHEGEDHEGLRSALHAVKGMAMSLHMNT